MNVLDPGRQPERTRLAWQRTTLTGVAALLVALRLLVEVSTVGAVLATAVVAVVLAFPVWSAARWQLRQRTLDGLARTDGRAPALLALLVVSGGLAALGYALAR